MLELFKALDQSLKDQKAYRSYYDEDKRRLKESVDKLNLRGWFKKFYNHMVFELEDNETTVKEKVQLRKSILHRVEEFKDQKLMKELFAYMVQQKYDYIQLCDELPTLDPESFEEVCHNLLFLQ